MTRAATMWRSRLLPSQNSSLSTARRNSARNMALCREFCDAFHVLPLTSAAAERSAAVRAELESSGARIGAYDVLIAEIALAEDRILPRTISGNSAAYQICKRKTGSAVLRINRCVGATRPRPPLLLWSDSVPDLDGDGAGNPIRQSHRL